MRPKKWPLATGLILGAFLIVACGEDRNAQSKADELCGAVIRNGGTHCGPGTGSKNSTTTTTTTQTQTQTVTVNSTSS